MAASVSSARCSITLAHPPKNENESGLSRRQCSSGGTEGQLSPHCDSPGKSGPLVVLRPAEAVRTWWRGAPGWPLVWRRRGWCLGLVLLEHLSKAASHHHTAEHTADALPSMACWYQV